MVVIYLIFPLILLCLIEFLPKKLIAERSIVYLFCIISYVVSGLLIASAQKACAKEPEYLMATVKYISDGDTIATNEYGVIRLQCIDAPELHFQGKTQYCKNNNINAGLLSKNALQKLIDNTKPIYLQCTGKSHNRKVCYVYQSNININESMIIQGYAFASQKYCNSQEMLFFNNAVLNKKGLFFNCELDLPCQFRKKC